MRWFTGTMTGLILAVVFCGRTAWADDAPATIQFDPALKSYLSGAETGPVPTGFDQTIVDHTSLPSKTVWLPLQVGESAADISVSNIGVESLGWKWADSGGGPLSTSSDFPYEQFVVSAEEDARLGRASAAVDEVVLSNQRYARLQLFPVHLSDDGELLFSSGLRISVNNRFVALGDLMTRDAIEQRKISTRPAHALGFVPEYVIVTDETMKPVFERLARYRTATGITTEVVLVDDALVGQTGVDDAERLRNYLKQFYGDGGYYVLLAGDETVLPIRYAHHRATSTTPAMYDLQICDLYFADLTGKWDCDGDGVYGEPRDDSADVTPELAVGRLPFSTTEEANNYVDKLIAYETNPGDGDFSYLTRAFFFAADQLRDYGSAGQHGLIAALLPGNFTVDTTTGVEAPSGLDPAPSNIDPIPSLDTLASGFGLVNINVHGRTDGFATKTSEYNLWPKSYIMSDATGDYGDLDSLPANNKVGLWYTVACDMGGFDMDQPPFNNPHQNIVENALSVKGAGAIAFVAYSRWGWVSTSHLLQATMYEWLLAHPDRPAIEAMYASQDKYYYYRDLVYGQNFYGDPTVRIYVNQPQPLTLNVSRESVPVITVMSAGQPVAGIEVSVSDTLGVLGSVFTDQNGRAVADFANDNLMTYYFGCDAPNATNAYAVLAPSIVTDVDEDNGTLPNGYELAQNYPNPFNPTTTISFTLARATRVELNVYNILGQQVATIVDEPMTAGRHEVSWDSRYDNAQPLPSGVYVYRLQAATFSDAKKMLLLK